MPDMTDEDWAARTRIEQSHQPALLSLIAEYARDSVAEVLATEPDLTGAEVLHRLGAIAEQARAAVPAKAQKVVPPAWEA